MASFAKGKSHEPSVRNISERSQAFLNSLNSEKSLAFLDSLEWRNDDRWQDKAKKEAIKFVPGIGTAYKVRRLWKFLTKSEK